MKSLGTYIVSITYLVWLHHYLLYLLYTVNKAQKVAVYKRWYSRSLVLPVFVIAAVTNSGLMDTEQLL